MPCPFLGSLSQAFVRNYGAALVRQYAGACPAMARGFRSLGGDETRCPFIQQNPVVADAPREMSEDIAPAAAPAPALPPRAAAYDYEGFLREQIAAKKRDHSYRVFRRVARLRAPAALEAGRPVTVWCANDYLGVARHPAVVAAAAAALRAHGAGAGGTRNIAGNSPALEALEAELAALHDKPAALVFSSCYVANDAALSTLAGRLPGCVVFSDAGNHASMIHGIRRSGAAKHVYRHNDVAHLRELLARAPPGAPKIVAFESVHSMSGSICPLRELLAAAREHGALTYVDEVHAVGLYGRRGAGVAAARGLAGGVDAVAGTLGKAFGGVGGYVAGSAALVDALRSLAPGFIFTTALPPASAAAALAAVRLLAGAEGRRLRAAHGAAVARLRRGLLLAGLPQLPSASHIVPVPVPGAANVARVAAALLARGHYAQPINAPTVPAGQERLRLAPGPMHTAEQVEELVLALAASFREAGVPFAELARGGTCRECHADLQHAGGYYEPLRAPIAA